MSTLLTDLVRRQTATSLIGIFSKTVDKVAEEIAHDLLRDPEFRAELQQLVRIAFQQAVKELNEPSPEPDLPSASHPHPLDDRLRDIATAIRWRG